MKKITLVSCGNYHSILYHLGNELIIKGFEINFVAFNIKAYKFLKSKNCNVLYVYDGFNKIYKNNTNPDFSNYDFNVYRSIMSDKKHWKKYSGRYQERIAYSFLKKFETWDKDYGKTIIFPIIESMDTHLFYHYARALKLKTLIHTHGRIFDISFFSEDYYESIPEYGLKSEIDENTWTKAGETLTAYLKNDSFLNYEKQTDQFISENPRIKTLEEKPLIEHPLRRLLLNLFYQFGIEKHNKQFSFWIKFLVFIESILVPFQKKLHYTFETLFLKTESIFPYKYDFYAIQFSPESSINTPDPEYIDQLTVIKKILFDDRRKNRILVVKEHPAMYMKRSLSFYRELGKLPNLRIAKSTLSAKELIEGAEVTYTVNGTVSVEAFVKGNKYEMFGHNFLSSLHQSISPKEFVSRLLLVSDYFVLYSPPRKLNNRFKRLFSKTNVVNMATSVKRTIELSSECQV